MQKNWWDAFPDGEDQQAGIVTKPADPTMPYKVPTAEADLTGKGISNTRGRIGIEGDTLSNEEKRLKLERDRFKAATGGDATVDERTAAFLATRLVGAADRISGATRANPAAARPNVLNNKFLSAIDKDLANSNQDPHRQAVEAAQLDLVDAALTLGTGAAYTPEQLEGYRKSYFPALGDDDYTVKSKQSALRTMIAAARLKAGSQAGAIDKALAGLGLDTDPLQVQGQPNSGDQITSTDKPYWDPSADSQGNVDIAKDQYERVNDPALAGVAAKMNAMFQAGAKRGDFIALLKQTGIPPKEVMQSIDRILIWQQKNKGYRGGYDTQDVEKTLARAGARSAFAGNTADSTLGASALGTANILSGGYLDEAAPGNTELNNIGKHMIAERHPDATFAGNVLGGVAIGLGGAAAGARLGIPAIGGGMFSPSAIGTDAVAGGIYGSGENNDNRLQGAAQGAAWGIGGGMVGRGLINGAAAGISPSGGNLAPLYEAGVNPTLGQRMGGIANRAEQAFGSIPVLGGIQRAGRNAAVREMQTGAFNQALGEIGEQLPKGVTSGTGAHHYMQHAFDKAYDTARSGLQFKPDQGFATDFGNIINEVGLLGKDSQNAFQALASKVGIKLRGRGGILNGDDYKIAVSEIDKKARAIRKNPNGDGELADALESFSAALDNGARRNSHPDAVALLDKADRGYAKAVIIEDAARRRGGDVGEFNGNQLDAAVQNISGGRRSRQYLAGKANMQDYATAAKQLGDTLPDSGSPERLMTGGAIAGGVGAAAKMVNPLAAAPYAIDTIASLPGVRQALGRTMAPRGGPAQRQVAEIMRRNAYLGSLFGVPLAITGSQ